MEGVERNRRSRGLWLGRMDYTWILVTPLLMEPAVYLADVDLNSKSAHVNVNRESIYRGIMKHRYCADCV